MSMTGYGDARHHDAALSAVVEVRAVNNRYLKIVGKYPDWLAPLEVEFERRMRLQVTRGTITVAIRIDRVPRPEDFKLNVVALASYWAQVQQTARELHANPPTDIGQLLVLDGVVEEHRGPQEAIPSESQLALDLFDVALKKFQGYRAEEGAAMATELERNIDIIGYQLDKVEQFAPQSVADFRNKLLERVRQSLADSGATVAETDLIRDVAIFADRGDINEEIMRLRSHLKQFGTFLAEPSSTGRKLDFLSQEMFRETNTIGSKANHVDIARCVVEMKAAVEKIREVLQNVE
ncbi:MAG: YicC family protein [Planctomycetota bacterium]|nr:YicC family protein [Planctomycetota bacterium]